MFDGILSLTNDQARAIKTRDASVALSAGAGCGKTFVLTERFLSHIEPSAVNGRSSAGISQLVAITFTEAAAREMRGRIRQKCMERMSRAKGETAAAWWALARRLDTARIHTIHGFCRSVLAEHAVEARLDPQFRVLDESQSGLLRLRTIDDFLRRKLATWDRNVFRLVRGGRIEALREDLLELMSQSCSPAFQKWMSRTPEELCQAWQDAAESQLPAALGRNLAFSTAGLRTGALLGKLRRTDGKLKSKCERLRFLLRELEAGHGTVPLFAELEEVAFFKDVSAKGLWTGDHAEHREEFQKALTDLRTKVRGLSKLQELEPEVALAAAEDGLHLLKLAAEANDEYAKHKAEQAALDFDDLIHRTVALLTAPEHEDLLRQAREGIFALLVDEFQDTDRQQLALIRALCGDGLAKGKLFFVGDRKQSIYRFRGAEPRVFQELAGCLPEAGRLALTKNFRSQPAVLDFVNALFVHEFAAEYEPLTPARPQVSPQPAVEFLWTKPTHPNPKSAGTAKLKVEDVRRAEAASIARRLKELLGAKEPLVWDAEAAAKGTPRGRPLTQGDIAILFRALGDVHLYEAALRAEGIDYYLVGGHAFYAQQEIRDFLHLLRAVASEADEVALAGVLRSPIFALHDETLFWLTRSGGSVRTLNAGLQLPRPPAELEGEERRKVTRAAETLQFLRELKDRESISAVVSAAMERTGYDAVLLAEFLGERKLANLNKLIDGARAADAAGNNLDAFVMQLSHFVAKLPREPLAATTSEGANVVRLMTIHQAKGLEFPLVVLPDLNRRAGGGRETVALHAELGPLVAPPRPGTRDQPSVGGHPATGFGGCRVGRLPGARRTGETSPVVGLSLYKVLEEDEEREEALRILYVGCTRAADYLILSSGFDSEDPTPSGLLARIARNFDLATGEVLRELPDDYEEPEVRITVCPLEDARSRAAAGGAGRLARVLQNVGAAKRSRGGLPDAVRPLACDLAPREFSFSRLSGALAEIERGTGDDDLGARDAPKDYDRGSTAGFDAAREEALALGQLVHAVLEAVPLAGEIAVPSLVTRYAATVLPAGCEEYRDRVVERGANFVERFVRSSRMRELIAARRVAREVDFLLPWPPQSGEETAADDPPYLIRGVIDCLYQDGDGGWHILDYKTNRVTRDQVASAAQSYELQLQVYALAVEQSLGVVPRELVLSFLDADEEWTVPWNASLRDRCVERVSEAIKRLVAERVPR